MRAFTGAVLAVVVASPLAAQEARLIANDPPAAELPYEFTQVTQVSELGDGRAVVLDRLDGTVRLVHLVTGISSVVGRAGDGPREYRLPVSLIPLGGDSVGIYDDANVRILIVRPDGTPGGFVSPFALASGARVGGTVGDGSGHLLGELRPRSGNDSTMLYRWRAGTDTAVFVTHVHRPVPDGVVALGRGMVRPGSFARPGTRNLWVSASDGTIAIVAFRPYHVAIIRPNGQALIGPTIPYERVAVDDSVKRAYLGSLPRRTTGVVTGRATGRATTVQAPARPVDPSTITWVAELPPFLGDAFVGFAPDGRLWIQRPTFGREGAHYDLVGPDGALVDRVRLPEGHRVVGFGRSAMYVVRRDADDLEFLQRRALPNR
jgi:hypothetical protein